MATTSIWQIPLARSARDGVTYLVDRCTKYFAPVSPTPEVIRGYVHRMRREAAKYQETKVVAFGGPWTWKGASDASIGCWLSAGGSRENLALRLARFAADQCHFVRNGSGKPWATSPDKRVASRHCTSAFSEGLRDDETVSSLLYAPRWGGIEGWKTLVSGRSDEVVSPTQQEAIRALSSVRLRVNPVIRAAAEQEGLGLPVGEETFTQRYFLDWRGRIYGVGAGAQGPDHIRACVDLAEAQPVSPDALAYAKEIIREEYGEEIVVDAATIAADPAKFLRETRHGKRYRALRAALAIVEVENTGRSGYILQQDAHCSGFQHIAMMWGDEEMARATNLTDRGQDLYTSVATAVATALEQDTTQSGAVADLILRFQTDVTNRVVAKPVVMLTGYGSSARSIAIGWAVALGWEEPTLSLDGGDHKAEQDAFWAQEPPETLINHPLRGMVTTGIAQGLKPRAILEDLASKYSEVMGVLFPSIQAFKAKVGEVFRSFDQYTAMTWVSPSGMTCQSKVVLVAEKEYPSTKEGWKEGCGDIRILTSAAGAMPNFVHSVDAALVVFVTVAAADRGIPIVPIHDSFGTAMAYAAALRNIVMDQMMEMDSYGFFTDFCVRAGIRRPGGGRVKRSRIQKLTGTVIG